MNQNLKRYELFGWDYEHYNPLTESAINWYRKFAHKTGGPILELACGSGRLLSALAESGYNIEGIDLSWGMLKLARKKTGKLPKEIRERIKLHKGNISNFRLDKRFNLIFIADNSFMELKSKDQQISCLTSVYHHLQPDGRFLLTVRNFISNDSVGSKKESQWSEPIIHPIMGDKVSRRVELNYQENSKLIKGCYQYKTLYGEGYAKIDEYPFTYPAMRKEDYYSLFDEVGFNCKLFVDYKEQRIDDGRGKIFCFVCTKR